MQQRSLPSEVAQPDPGATERTFAFWGPGRDPALEGFREELRREWERRGYDLVTGDDPDAAVIFNFIDPAKPKPFRRRRRATYVIVVHTTPRRPAHVIKHEYPIMVRALANLGLLVVPGDGCYFVTPEQGFYEVPDAGGLETWVRETVERIMPLATSRLVIDNRFEPDLEPELWDGDELTGAMLHAGQRLDALGLLPAPFPLEEIVDEKELRAIKRIYGIGGLSYGNLSVRKDGRRYWMSASGVDKSNLRVVGRDILMVKDYAPATGTMVLSVPPNVEPRRASVDAIEHWMIYQEHPEVNAIVHVHGWIPGIPATMFNYPCGTAELATAVADIIRDASDPGACVVGLKNHGITVTGHSLDEIFARIEPVIETQVPMSA
jgi:ribulose-5-phosphate 4-epimerase/fuculose-1-phosphate aldolase